MSPLDTCNECNAPLSIGLGDADSEIDALREEIDLLMEGMELAWGVIANAYGGDWNQATDDWWGAATRWRDNHWHPSLDRNVRHASEEVETPVEGK